MASVHLAHPLVLLQVRLVQWNCCGSTCTRWMPF